MIVRARRGLEDLVEPASKIVTVACDERSELGLQIPNYLEVYVRYYNDKGARATAEYEEPSSVIILNILPIAVDVVANDVRPLIEEAMEFFDISRYLLGATDEQIILDLIAHPVITLRDFEDSFSKSGFRRYVCDLEAKGVSFDGFRKFVKKTAKKVRESLSEIHESLYDCICHADLDSFRHELDHADFHNTEMWKRLFRRSERFKDLQSGDDNSIAEQVKRSYTRLTNETIDTQTLMELRALFFNFVKPVSWKTFDRVAVQRQVYAHFSYYYLEREFTVPILRSILFQDPTDKNTSNYLFQRVNLQVANSEALTYHCDPQKVDYRKANHILYTEMPKWKRRIDKRAREAVVAIGGAFRQDPSRLFEAKDARTFREYLRICSP